MTKKYLLPFLAMLMLSSAYGEGELNRFVDFEKNAAELKFIENPDFWAKEVDFSALSVWNDATKDMWGGGCNYRNLAGVAISPRHVLCSHHYGIPTGTTLYFLGPKSGGVGRKVVASDYVAQGTDLRVCLLDEDLPRDITPLKILPENYADYLGDGKGRISSTMNQYRELIVQQLAAIPSEENRTRLLSAMKPKEDEDVAKYKSVISGDSGCPRFLIVDNEPILISLMWYGGSGSGVFIPHFRREIQNTMNRLAKGYELGEVSLAALPLYTPPSTEIKSPAPSPAAPNSGDANSGDEDDEDGVETVEVLPPLTTEERLQGLNIELPILSDYEVDYTNAVEGLVFTGVERTSSNVVNQVRWDAETSITSNKLVVVASDALEREDRRAVLGLIDTSNAVSNTVSFAIDIGDYSYLRFDKAGFFWCGDWLDSDGDGLINIVEKLIIGSDPDNPDSDNDGMPDGWEVKHELNPSNRQDADQDSDGDGLSNFQEFINGSSPIRGDTDDDGISDKEEIGYIVEGNPLPWLQFSSYEDISYKYFYPYESSIANIDLASNLNIQGCMVSSVAVSSHGWVFLNKTGYQTDYYGDENADFTSAINRKTLALAISAGNVFASDDPRTATSTIKVGYAQYQGNHYLLIQCNDLYGSYTVLRSDVISYQVAIPMNNTDRAYVRYRNVAGECMDGRNSRIGMQTMEARHLIPYAMNVPGSIYSNKGLTFMFGSNGDPGKYDTDEDGLSDMQEKQLGTNPNRKDSDGDGIPDMWEIDHNLNPMDAADGEQNLAVFQNLNAVPASENTRELEFNINGDYAAWILKIEGLDEQDRNVRYISMREPDAGTNVVVSLVKGCKYRLSMQWLNCDGHDDSRSPWYCWQAEIDGLPNQQTYSNYSNIRNEGVATIVCGSGWLADNRSGLLTAHIDQNATDGAGNVAEGLESILYVLEDPVLLADYNHDGKIDECDSNMKGEGRIFRFWVNDDTDYDGGSELTDNGEVDIPGALYGWSDERIADSTRLEVCGRRDLIDFTPLGVKVPVPDFEGNEQLLRRIKYRLYQRHDALNVVWSNLDWESASSFQTNSYVTGFGPALTNAPEFAPKEVFANHVLTLPLAYVDHLRCNNGIGTFLVEGADTTSRDLVLDVCFEDQVICSTTLQMQISDVEDMYRWMGIRYLCDQWDDWDFFGYEPYNMPDEDTNGKHIIFVHGYNVNVSSARAWAAEMYKRLWQAGSCAAFTAVDWFGDDSQLSVPVEGDVSPNYYANVEHAFMSAQEFADNCAMLTGEKIIMAHSLGNMLVSAAAKDFNLQYDKYYMMNAAVPIEAYRVDADPETLMIDGAWKDLGVRFRASHFSELFITPYYANDFRKGLSWKGRFSGLHDLINCYSPTEEVLANPTSRKFFGREWEGFGGAWSQQELFKGCSVWYPINAFTFSGVRIEGGWGINAAYMADPLAYIPLYGFLPYYFANFSTGDIITQPLFTSFNDSRMHSTAALNIEDYQLRAKMLGDAIPAETFAVGANPFDDESVAIDYNYQADAPNNWPRENDRTGAKEWHHSDIKSVAYLYTYNVFTNITSSVRGMSR